MLPRSSGRVGIPRVRGKFPTIDSGDASSAHTIDHDGAYFSVRGPFERPTRAAGASCSCPAGASEGGIDLAARHGEIIYCNILSRPAGQAFGNKVRDRARTLGRDPADIRNVPGLVVILGESRQEALRKHELFSGAGSEDGLLHRFVKEHGIDPADFDPDAVLEPSDSYRTRTDCRPSAWALACQTFWHTKN